MTNDEFLDQLPWLQGIAWAAMSDEHMRNGIREMGKRMFWLHPKYFALVHLAREHGERFAELVREYENTSAQRYGVEPWSDAEPRREVELSPANVLREYLAMLESKG